ncbi:MAG: 4-(cytidine 5'-diphospho)-2-C-methyl-D-erythritol kinase, partial [Chlamydiales bacterium]|nr:4-(cytidine 5'-diphospho)-2-C-methyl-D-erythritol kinase [Chlamydiales bacterium]
MPVFFSPAKINLFFRTLFKRGDGFHEIASLYQAITLGDILEITPSDTDLLTSSCPTLACDETNLIHTALTAYRRNTGASQSFHIHLEKKIPIQAGLGGGSSNAATAMWAVNALSSSPVSEDLLRSWSATFSSDAPFFFSSGTAYCTGRGESLQSITPLQKKHLWIAKPEGGLSTPLVYRHCRPDLALIRDPSFSLEEIEKGNPVYYNDLEEAAFSLRPDLAEIKEKLVSLGFSHVCMTGSGVAFFCMGACENPSLPSVTFYPVSFLNRKAKNWYDLPQ